MGPGLRTKNPSETSLHNLLTAGKTSDPRRLFF